MNNKLSVVLGLFFMSAALFVSSFTSNSDSINSSEIKWMSFQEGYDLAVKEKKMIVVDMYTEWCGWCKRMDKTTFSDSAVISLVNANFVAIKFNPEVNAKYMVGNKVMTGVELKLWLGKGKQYGYPTTYFWVAPHKDEEIDLAVGYQDPVRFQQLLAKYIK